MNPILGVLASSVSLGNGYWMSTLTGSYGVDLFGNAVGSDGSVYVTGGAYDSIGGNSTLLAKFDGASSLTWQRKVSSVGAGYGIGVDSSNNVYCIGTDYVSATNYQFTKFNSSGSLQLQRKLDSFPNYQQAVDSSGNVYLSTSSNGVTKYNSSGSIVWQKEIGAFSGDVVTVDSSGNVYAIGRDRVSGADRLLAAKFDSSGSLSWVKETYSGSTDFYPYAAVVDSSGNVCIASQAGDTFALLVVKYDSSGTLQWSQDLYGAGGINGIACDPSGNVYILGFKSASPYSHFVLAKYNSSGTLQWQRFLKRTDGNQTSNFSNEIYNGLTVTSDAVYVVGYTGVSSTEAGFFAKLPLDGSKTGTYTIGSITVEYSAGDFSDTSVSLTENTPSFSAQDSSNTSSTPSFTSSTPTYTTTTTTL